MCMLDEKLSELYDYVANNKYSVKPVVGGHLLVGHNIKGKKLKPAEEINSVLKGFDDMELTEKDYVLIEKTLKDIKKQCLDIGGQYNMTVVAYINRYSR